MRNNTGKHDGRQQATTLFTQTTGNMQWYKKPAEQHVKLDSD
jgi:hypothetical protein